MRFKTQCNGKNSECGKGGYCLTDFYLITGFLGAGKTTFIKNFLRLFSGKRIQLIINEFGHAGVDGALLQGRVAALTEISNGSVFCACRSDRFEAALSEAAAAAPDVLLTEASGLSAPSDITRILTGFPTLYDRGQHLHR